MCFCVLCTCKLEMSATFVKTEMGSNLLKPPGARRGSAPSPTRSPPREAGAPSGCRCGGAPAPHQRPSPRRDGLRPLSPGPRALCGPAHPDTQAGWRQETGVCCSRSGKERSSFMSERQCELVKAEAAFSYHSAWSWSPDTVPLTLSPASPRVRSRTRSGPLQSTRVTLCRDML